MAFDRQNRPVQSGRIEFRVIQNAAGGGLSAWVEWIDLDANGSEVRTRGHDLWGEMSASRKTSMATFMEEVRTKINAEAYDAG
jgi:hypothetical protein